jgi:hypothetical protein
LFVYFIVDWISWFMVIGYDPCRKIVLVAVVDREVEVSVARGNSPILKVQVEEDAAPPRVLAREEAPQERSQCS